MADFADLSDGYAERIVEESLRLIRNRQIEEDADCTFCEEFPCETLPNGAHSMLCTRCRKEKEQAIMAVVLPVSTVGEQGDDPEDTWQPTMIASNRYRKNWFIRSTK